MINLNALANLEVLSLSRNNIKKISGLDEIGNFTFQFNLNLIFLNYFITPF